MENKSSGRTASRIASIDALRGLTILVMIFVNDVAGVTGTPPWMHHWKFDSVTGVHDYAANGMTFVDWVFPGFLFIVGMAIPFALGRRMDRGESLRQVWGHIGVRTLGLLLIGVFMVNAGAMSDEGRLPRVVWALLMYLMVILVWNTGPKEPGGLRTATNAMRGVGILGLVALAVFFHGSSDPASIAGRPAWWGVMALVSVVALAVTLLVAQRGRGPSGVVPVMGLLCGLYFFDAIGFLSGEWQIDMRPSWWGILGLIGWAYLVACVAYTLFRKQPAALMGVVALLYCLFFADKVGTFSGWPLRNRIDFGSMLGSHAAITLSGVLLGIMLLPDSPVQGHWRRIRWATLYGLGLFVGGVLLYQLQGVDAVHDMFKINKNAATPTWCLISSAITVWIWVVLYVIMDVVGFSAWTIVFKPAGENPLFAYILHPIVIYAAVLLGEAGWNLYAELGDSFQTGLWRSIVVALGVTWLVGGMRRVGIWLRL